MVRLRRGCSEVIASGVLFGVAHAGWGGFTAKVNWSATAGVVASTAVLGALYAIAYLASRRSLMPVTFGHLVMDVLLEPWLVLAALSGAAANSH